MKSGLLDKNNVEICDGDLIIYTRKRCTCSESTKTQEYTCKVKFEYGAFYLLFTGDDSIYDKEVSTQLGITLGDLAMRTDDHGDGYSYYLPSKKLSCIEVRNELLPLS